MFKRGADCPRRLWLDHHDPAPSEDLSASEALRIEAGHRIGELARSLFPDGTFASPIPSDQAGDMFSPSLLERKFPLFEVEFRSARTFARADILAPIGDFGWAMWEVKSTGGNNASEFAGHINDLAFQVVTARNGGVSIDRAGLILVDTSYIWDGGNYDAESILKFVDVTTSVEDATRLMSETSASLVEAIDDSQLPDASFGTRCTKCDYYARCHQDAGPDHIFRLPHISQRKVDDLLTLGITTLGRIPDDFALTDNQTKVATVHRSGEPFISPGLAGSLEGISFPAAFVDFEASISAFPVFPGTRPYESICFQWSGHVLESPSSPPTHFEYLASCEEDPREEFCATLYQALHGVNSFVHYSPYEMTQLRAMAQIGVPSSAALLASVENMAVDLHSIVKDHVYLPEFGGRTSIKIVLPALVPDLDYGDLAIGNGDDAMAAFQRLARGDYPADEVATVRQNLLDYCEMDTFAMVAIYRRLLEIANL